MAWQKGQSGNPNGRPKISLTEEIKRNLSQEVTLTDGKKVKVCEAVIQALVRKAVKGDLKAIDMLLDRNDGKCPDILQADINAVEGVIFCDEDGKKIESENDG